MSATVTLPLQPVPEHLKMHVSVRLDEGLDNVLRVIGKAREVAGLEKG